MYKLIVFIPIEAKESVKEAMFKVGGGTIGNYDSCCFEVLGTGQFRPLEGSNPAIGDHHQLEFVKEVRVELVVKDAIIKDVIAAMKTAHPYESVAYDVIRLEDF
ncbi:MAG: NGG1p interacting factor NIF3 [Halobacteriovorax sp.]|nr:NGG1p interacting factor NIF3 [Halobacteriovorax sp.]